MDEKNKPTEVQKQLRKLSSLSSYGLTTEVTEAQKQMLDVYKTALETAIYLTEVNCFKELRAFTTGFLAGALALDPSIVSKIVNASLEVVEKKGW